MSALAPQWLTKARDDRTHVAHALSVLADRERARTRASAATRGAPVNLKHRLASVPVLIHPRSHLTEHYSVVAGSRAENMWSNRYMDIEPYDRTRVPVSNRYFNGSWVREYYGGAWWIATQAPLPATVHEFLSVIAGIEPLHPPASPKRTYARVRTVVQLTNLVEAGHRKADPYFPSHVGEHIAVPPPAGRPDLPEFKVTLLKSEAVPSSQCIKNTVSIASGSSHPVVFYHLHYHAWPDHGVPDDRVGLLNFERFVDRVNKDTSALPAEPNPDADPPVMVHCSAGVGRTGTFIALASLLRESGLLGPHAGARPSPGAPFPKTQPPVPPSPLGPLPEDVSWDRVAQEIDMLREQRPCMVQRPEQALLVYETLHMAFLKKGDMANGGSVGKRM